MEEEGKAGCARVCLQGVAAAARGAFLPLLALQQHVLQRERPRSIHSKLEGCLLHRYKGPEWLCLSCVSQRGTPGFK
jgi:hypothetical protein